MTSRDQRPVAVDLSPDEVELLARGLHQWHGPATPTDAVAVAAGFGDAVAMSDALHRLVAVVRTPDPALSPRDWMRAQAAVELAFGSDVLGCGYEWSTVTGLSDASTVETLRGLQRKLIAVWAGLDG